MGPLTLEQQQTLILTLDLQGVPWSFQGNLGLRLSLCLCRLNAEASRLFYGYPLQDPEGERLQLSTVIEGVLAWHQILQIQMVCLHLDIYVVPVETLVVFIVNYHVESGNASES